MNETKRRWQDGKERPIERKRRGLERAEGRRKVGEGKRVYEREGKRQGKTADLLISYFQKLSSSLK